MSLKTWPIIHYPLLNFPSEETEEVEEEEVEEEEDAVMVGAVMTIVLRTRDGQNLEVIATAQEGPTELVAVSDPTHPLLIDPRMRRRKKEQLWKPM